MESLGLPRTKKLLVICFLKHSDGFRTQQLVILEPKSINSKEPPVLQPEWESDFMVFVDVFDPKLNIAALCTVAGAQIINQEFFNAYVKLKEGDSFQKVLYSHDTIPTQIAIKTSKHKRGVPKS